MHPQLQFEPRFALVGVAVYALYRLLISVRWHASWERLVALSPATIPAAAEEGEQERRQRLRAEFAAFRAEELDRPAGASEHGSEEPGEEDGNNGTKVVAKDTTEIIEALIKTKPKPDTAELQHEAEEMVETMEPGEEPEPDLDADTLEPPPSDSDVAAALRTSARLAQPSPLRCVALGFAVALALAVFAAAVVSKAGRGFPTLPASLGGPPEEDLLEDVFVFDAFVGDAFGEESGFAAEAPPPTPLDSPAPDLAPVAREPPTKVSGPPLVITLTRTKVQENEMEDFVRSAYSGTIMVGSPPEPFTIVFDTRSGHLMLPSTYCHSDTCKVHKRYRRIASSTGKDIDHDGSLVPAGASRDQIGVSFGTGEATGVFVEDIVCVGSDAEGAGNVSASEIEKMIDDGQLPKGCVMMRMIAATELSEDPFAAFEFDGILGLGLDGLSQTPDFNYINVISRTVGGWGGASSNMFAVFLANNEGEDSEIALGGWELAHLQEELSWGAVPDPELGHWLLNIKRIRVDNEVVAFCNNGCTATVDTGSSLLAVPTAVFPDLFEMLKHPTPLQGNCDGPGPQLHFEFEGFTVTLGPSEHSRPEPLEQDNRRPRWHTPQTKRTDLRCNPSLMTLDLPEPLGPKLFVLGEPVLRKYYTVYDAASKYIGFGRAKHTGGTSREHLIMDGALPMGRQTPTMFDVFRWRKNNQWRGHR